MTGFVSFPFTLASFEYMEPSHLYKRPLSRAGTLRAFNSCLSLKYSRRVRPIVIVGTFDALKTVCNCEHVAIMREYSLLRSVQVGSLITNAGGRPGYCSDCLSCCHAVNALIRSNEFLISPSRVSVSGLGLRIQYRCEYSIKTLRSN